MHPLTLCRTGVGAAAACHFAQRHFTALLLQPGVAGCLLHLFARARCHHTQVPLDVIEWQPVYHQAGATGLSGGAWSGNWQVRARQPLLRCALVCAAAAAACCAARLLMHKPALAVNSCSCALLLLRRCSAAAAAT